MANDRLLSELEILDIKADYTKRWHKLSLDEQNKTRPYTEEPLTIARAQDARTAAAVNEEWVKWGNEPCPHVHHVLPNRPKRACDVCCLERIQYLSLEEWGFTETVDVKEALAARDRKWTALKEDSTATRTITMDRLLSEQGKMVICSKANECKDIDCPHSKEHVFDTGCDMPCYDCPDKALGSLCEEIKKSFSHMISDAQIASEYYQDGLSADHDDDAKDIEEFKKTKEYQFAVRVAEIEHAKTAKAVNEDWVKWFDDLIIAQDKGCLVLDLNEDQWQERKRSVGL